jgi:glycosyltransferase involved in cell wall biosynthesis
VKVAIVCDWLLGTGGAERVVSEIHNLYPNAPIYTSQYDSDPKIWYRDDWFAGADIRTTWLQKFPKSLKKFLPVLRTWAFSHLDLSQYDLVISVSGAEAKGVKTGAKTLHINYCHAPTHYYWDRYGEYLAHPGFGKLNWLARIGLKFLVSPLRRWDRKAALRPDVMIANSTHTQNMIKKYYSRDSIVIHPPVDTKRFKPKEEHVRHGFVTAGRQTPYKRIDLAVTACSELSVPLLVIGNGPEHRKLKKMAGRKVTFLANVSDNQIPEYFQTSKAFIFPTNTEDFGVLGVEAMAAGTPVIAYKKGGPLDYIIPRKTGLFYEKQTTSSLMKVLRDFNHESFKPEYLIEHASRFSVEVFRSKMSGYINEQLSNKRLA